jgi:hypothetical protein
MSEERRLPQAPRGSNPTLEVFRAAIAKEYADAGVKDEETKRVTFDDVMNGAIEQASEPRLTSSEKLRKYIEDSKTEAETTEPTEEETIAKSPFAKIVLERINSGDLAGAEELVRQAEMDVEVAEEQVATVFTDEDEDDEDEEYDPAVDAANFTIR